MKYPTLQKVMLMTIALVASLALSAQAGKPRLSSTSQNHNRLSPSARAAGNPFHNLHILPKSVTADYQYDDGSSEQSVAFGDGTQNFESLWFNQFAVIPGATSISCVQIAWGTPAFPQPIDGTPTTVAIWSDPNGDGDPSDAVLLGSVTGTMQNSNTDTFINYAFSPPVDVSAFSSFFVGDFTPAHPGTELFYESQDTDDLAPNKSWVAANGDGSPVDINMIGNNDFIGTIDSFGLPGNWMIRANVAACGSPTPTPTPTPTISPTPTPSPGNALWYNGDFDGVDGLTNEQDTFATGFSHIYDDFNVTDSGGWDVTSVFSDNLASTNITSATWEIRSGVSAGNGGTIVASGMTVTPQVTATGRSGFGFIEFMVEVDGLTVHLDPGTYWLNVTPVDSLDGGRSFDSTTSGANCVGTPCGDNDTAFLDSTLFGAVFEPVADFGSQFHDFSMGVNGSVSGGGGEITLTAKLRRHHKTHLVLLSWTPADGGRITVLRDGVFRDETNDDGRTQDRVGLGETHTYQVCETDTGTCSNEVTIKIP
jgi:hypothetical protein